ncbi:hypothetical protein PGT21_036340 [Puccinia graminis f. sp. tritici]|uniref:Uncharacterized protein n=1 Tax=Puccinia graminis f. sp. tritici TaxID=56615 RepID=A0A5B0PGS0_PUCGR|nr:hypothetical protein PGT21_036340 [Puccinia graminis f. sp. tritici]KAA1100381.1 hypothetical protein PGTUg99_024684 [Puccinia graminis f. sp. tritici]
MAVTESDAINTPAPTPTASQKDPMNGGTDLSSTQEGKSEEKKKRKTTSNIWLHFNKIIRDE